MDKKFTAKEAAVAVLKKAEEMFKSSKLAKAETNHNEKGINNSLPNKDMVINKPHARHATSKMGNEVREGKLAAAKETAKKMVGEIAKQPKPNLTKAQDLQLAKYESLDKSNRGETEHGMNRDQKEMRRKIMNPGHPRRDNEIKDGGRENVNHPTDKKGVSHVGEAVRRGANGYAKGMVKEKINSSKFQTKIGQNPDLPKSEEMAKATGHEKGVATTFTDSKTGTSVRGHKIRDAAAAAASNPKRKDMLMTYAKENAKNTLSQSKAMPTPNLPKSEDMSKMDDLTIAMAEHNVTPQDGVQQEVHPEHKPNGNPPWGTEPGTYKLAKFMGHRDAKRKMKHKMSKPVESSEMDKGEPMKKSAPRMDQHKTKQIAIVAGGDKSKVPGTKAKITQDSLEGFSSDKMKDQSTHTKTLLGTSSAGASLKHGNSSEAKATHKETLSKLKAQPKPNLTKAEMGKHGMAKPGEKGVHQPPSKTAVEMNMANDPGESTAGFHARMASKTKNSEYSKNAKDIHERKLADLKAMPKPKLTKDEE